MKAFLKRTAVWATVWALLFSSVMTYNTMRHGDGASLFEASTIAVFAFVWVASFLITLFVMIMRLVRTFGFNLGHQIVANPRGGAMSAIRKAARDASPPAER